MSIEVSAPQHLSYERRLELVDKISGHFMSSETGSSYFLMTVLPNLVPEQFPESNVLGIPWIGKRAKDAIAESSIAFGDMLHYWVEEEDMTLADARDCAEVLKAEFDPSLCIEPASDEVEGAQLYHLRIRKVQTERRESSTGTTGTDNRPSLRLV